MLTVALTAGVGVATTRALGLRDFDERVLAAAARRLIGAPAPMPDPMAKAEEEAMESGMAMAAPEAMATPAPTAAPTVRPAPARTAMPPAAPARTATPAPSQTPTPTSAPQAAIAPPAQRASYDWISPLDKEPARVSQLLRRAAFGATGADLERALSEGYARTVERLIETPPSDPPELPAAPAGKLQVGALRQWWIDHMVASPTPFTEAMTLFWHGHFTSDYRKVGLQQPYLQWQNLTWRKLALGDLGTLLRAVTVDPAMLRFLDLGISTGRNPNENYARELMELFTLGPGSFTEDDVRAGAKALAGWRLPRANETVRTGVFDRSRAYAGTLTFLGKTGTFDLDAVVERILAQDAAAPFVTRVVLEYFVTPMPAPATVSRLAARFRASKYDLKTLMRDVLTSPEFTAADNYRALVKSPTEFMVSAARALGGTPLGRILDRAATGMGQALFDPPNVGGWPTNAGWISSNTMVARANFAYAAVSQTRALPSAADVHLRVLDGVLAPQTAALLNEGGDDRRRWSVVLSSPEFQLK